MGEIRKNEGIMEALGRVHSSIAVIDVKMDALKEANDKEHKSIDVHFTTLNNQTAKNTAFRHRGSVYVLIGAFVISFGTTLLLNYL